MSKFHTHYDNLKVARNAPTEVIRASYLALSKKFHPDVNDSSDAKRVMQILNQSYEILSNPVTRIEHDKWIHQTELNSIHVGTYQESYTAKSTQAEMNPKNSMPRWKKALIWTLAAALRNPRIALAIIVLCAININSEYSSREKTPARKYPTAHFANGAEKSKEYKRPLNAPNGLFWPDKSGYLRGYDLKNDDGYSTLTINNLKNENDFYVKLTTSSPTETKTVRHLLLKARERFSLKNLSPGNYQIMYLDLDSGHITKSQEFKVTETNEGDGIRYSNMSITLFRVRNGNFKSEAIGLDEFLGADSVTEATNQAAKSDSLHGET